MSQLKEHRPFMNTHFTRTQKQIKTSHSFTWGKNQTNTLCRESNRPDPVAHWQVLNFSESQCHALKHRHNNIDSPCQFSELWHMGRTPWPTAVGLANVQFFSFLRTWKIMKLATLKFSKPHSDSGWVSKSLSDILQLPSFPLAESLGAMYLNGRVKITEAGWMDRWMDG